MIAFNRISTNTDTGSLPRLDAFQGAAAQGPAVVVGRDGQEWTVLAQGATPSQRSVSWVQSDLDTTSAFVGALKNSFSAGISKAVARELNLAPAPNRPLSSRTVTHAIDMAETARSAMQGVDFLTRLQFGAVQRGAEFTRACDSSGLNATDLNADQLRDIDALMDRQFENAAREGQTPVTSATAETWLQQALKSVLR